MNASRTPVAVGLVISALLLSAHHYLPSKSLPPQPNVPPRFQVIREEQLPEKNGGKNLAFLVFDSQQGVVYIQFVSKKYNEKITDAEEFSFNRYCQENTKK